MKKRILAIFLCIFSIFVFCGCGSAIYLVEVDSTGVVTQAFKFTFNKKDIEDAGKTVTDFRENVIYVANSVVNNAYNNFTNSHQSDEIMTTWSGDKCPFSQIVSYVYQNMDVGINGYRFFWEPSKDGKTITCTISLKFLTIYAYEYFYDVYPDSEDEENTYTEDHFFYVKSITESQSAFYDLKNSDITEYFLTYFGDSFKLSDMDYCFCYITPNQKMYSDADYVENTSSGYAHVWKFSASDLENGNGIIHTYTVKIRAYPWYILAVGVSIVASVVIWIVCKAKEKKKVKIEVKID